MVPNSEMSFQLYKLTDRIGMIQYPSYNRYLPAAPREGECCLRQSGQKSPSRKIKLRPAWKTLLDFRGNLKIRHFIGLFEADDTFRQPLRLQALLKFVLRHCWTKNLDFCGIPNLRNDLVIIFAEMVPVVDRLQ